MVERKCEKCGRNLVEHTTKVLTLPMTSDPDLKTKNKIDSVTILYCKVCEKFETELPE